MLGEAAARRHLGAGAGRGDAPGAERKETRRGDQVGDGHVGTPRSVLRREVGDRVVQLREPGDVALAEIAIVKVLVQDQPQHTREKRRVLSGPHLQVDVRKLRDHRASGVDADELEAARLCVAQPPRRAERRHAALPGVVRSEGVVADHHGHIRPREGLRSAEPGADAAAEIDLGWLIDRDAGVEARTAEPLVETQRHRQRGRVHEPVRAAVGGDRARTVPCADRRETSGDLVERGAARNRDERSVRQSSPGAAQSLGMICLRGQLTSLHAGVAAKEGIRDVAAYGHGALALDVDLDRAICVAETTEGLSGVHRGPLECRPADYRRTRPGRQPPTR